MRVSLLLTITANGESVAVYGANFDLIGEAGDEITYTVEVTLDNGKSEKNTFTLTTPERELTPITPVIPGGST